MRQFRRLDEFAVIMCTFGQHTQDIFCANDREQIRFWITVNGREEDMTTWFGQFITGLNNRGWIRYMFQHFHTGHDIVLTGLFFCELLYWNLTVFNIADTFLLGMDACHIQWRFAHINAQHLSTTARHAF